MFVTNMTKEFLCAHLFKMRIVLVALTLLCPFTDYRNPELPKLFHLPMICQSDLYRVQSLYIVMGNINCFYVRSNVFDLLTSCVLTYDSWKHIQILANTCTFVDKSFSWYEIY